MTSYLAQTGTMVANDATQPTPTTLKLGPDVSDAPPQPQESAESQAYETLHGVIYTLEKYDADDADGISRLIDGDETWNKVMQLQRFLTLSPTSPDYQPPTTVVKQIYAGSINKVFGFEISSEEKDVVLTCILFIALCNGKASLGNSWQLIAFRLISILPVQYLRFFLSKMESHIKSINADILKALLDRFKTDADFINLLRNIFTHQEQLKSDSSPNEMLSILSSCSGNDIVLADLSKDDQLIDKARIVMLNEMIANKYPTLNQKARAEIIAEIMNKKDGEKINQYLSSGIDLTPQSIIKINELMRKLGIPGINSLLKPGTNTYKR